MDARRPAASTLVPGRARTSPSMMTRSFGARPLTGSRAGRREVADARPSFGTTVPSGATVITMCCDWSGTTAASGTSSAGAGVPRSHAQPRELARRQEQVRIRHRGAGMDRAAQRSSALSMKSSVPCAIELCLVAERDLDLVGERPFESRRARARTSDSRIRSCRSRDRSDRARRCVASNVVGLVAPRLPAIRLPTETRCAPMRPVKGAVMRQYSRSNWASRICALASSMAACAAALVGRALVDRSRRCRNRCRFSCCARHSSRLASAPGRARSPAAPGLGQPDLVGPRIDDEEQIALVDDLPVLEVYFGQRAADLGAQLDRVDRRELAEEAVVDCAVRCNGWADRYPGGDGGGATAWVLSLRHTAPAPTTASRQDDARGKVVRHLDSVDPGPISWLPAPFR